MPANASGKAETPFPTRGSRCLDWWQAPDLLELAAIRAQVARFDAACERIAAEIQREERREQKRRERATTAPAAGSGALGRREPNGGRG